MESKVKASRGTFIEFSPSERIRADGAGVFYERRAPGFKIHQPEAASQEEIPRPVKRRNLALSEISKIGIAGYHGRDSLEFKAALYDDLSAALGVAGVDLLTARLRGLLGQAGQRVGVRAELDNMPLSPPPAPERTQCLPGKKDDGTSGAAISQEIPVQAAITAFLEDRKFRERSSNTLDNYGGFLRRSLGQFSHVPTDHMVIRDKLNEFKGKTKETYWLYFSTFYAFLEKEYGLPNPMARLDPPQRSKGMPSHLNPEQTAQLAKADLSHRDRVLINLFSESAIRPGEVIDSHGHPLRFCDIHGDHIKVAGKRGERIVPVTPQTRDGLLSLQGKRPSSLAVFIGDDGHTLSYWGVRKIVNKAFKRAGITGVKPCAYTLRHSFGGAFLARGGDLATLQKLLGHAHIQTTMIYTHIADKQLMDAYKKHGPSADNTILSVPVNEGISPALEPAERLPQLLDRMIALGQLAQELKHSLGGNGHWPAQLKEIKTMLGALGPK